jgi:hypothetical protein
MNDAEYNTLNAKVAESGLTQQAFVINAIKQTVIMPMEDHLILMNISMTFTDLIRQLRGLATNVNQMAKWANTTGELPTEHQLDEIYENLDLFRKECDHTWLSIRSLITPPRHTRE